MAGAVWCRGAALQTLRWFPPDKRIIAPFEKVETDQVQPLPNQRMSSHVEKSSYLNAARRTPDSVRIEIEYSAQDFLAAYELWRWAESR